MSRPSSSPILKALEALPDPAAGRALCAVSGGADSMALLHALILVGNKHGFAVEAAHIEHGIRGSASIRDAAWVSFFCRDAGIPLHIAHADVPGYAVARGIGLETAARDLRYALLRAILHKSGASYCVLAHHRDDQAETLLLNLIRGSGARGLRAMRADGGWLKRPLLDVPGSALRAYAIQHGLPFTDDATNAVADNPRNAIRLRVLPELRAINPSASGAISRAAAALAEDDDALSAWAEASFARRFHEASLDARNWDEPPAIRKRALQRALIAWGGMPEAAHLDTLDRWIDMLGAPPRRLDLPGLRVLLRRGILAPILKHAEEEDPCSPPR